MEVIDRLVRHAGQALLSATFMTA